MLILLDKPVEQIRILTSKSTGDLGALFRHRTLEIEGGRVHTTDTYGDKARKDASAREKGSNWQQLAATLLSD